MIYNNRFKKTRSINQTNLNILQNDIATLSETLRIQERNFALGNNNALVSQEEIQSTLQGTLLSTLDSLWAVSESAIEPLGGIIDDVQGDDDIEDDAEDLSRDIRNFVERNNTFF